MVSGRNKSSFRNLGGEKIGTGIPKEIWKHLREKKGFKTGDETLWLIGKETGELKVINLNKNKEYSELLEKYQIPTSEINNNPELSKALYNIENFKNIMEMVQKNNRPIIEKDGLMICPKCKGENETRWKKRGTWRIKVRYDEKRKANINKAKCRLCNHIITFYTKPEIYNEKGKKILKRSK